MKHIAYRPEIDGLRAVAVFLVILYHVNPVWIPSGFIGVDIFLVISGFLITKIIVESHDKKQFSVIEFYSRRVKRIIPLTYFVLTVVLICGWFLSYPSVYRAEANSTISALYFVANVRFALMGNYFTSADDNPLLHLWSLSLEEQFYFIWPIGIAIFYRFGWKKVLPITTVSLMVVSILLAVFFVNRDSLHQYAYYILPTRMAGLVFGATLALVAIRLNRKSNALPIVGFMLIAWGAFYLDKSYFPSYTLMLPLIGCGIVILTPDSVVTKAILSNKICGYLGRISFSLYMWHWPMLVYSRRYIEKTNSGIEYGSALYLFIYFLFLIVVSAFSNVYLEAYFRRLRLKNSRVFVFIFLFPLIVLTAVGFFISKSNGLPVRYGLTDKMTRIETIECYGGLTDDYCFIHQVERQGEGLLLIGDSHAGSLTHFIKGVALDENIFAYDASSGSCAFYSGDFVSTQCERVKGKIDKILSNRNIKYIAVAKRYDDMDVSGVNELIAYVHGKVNEGYKVVLFNQVPKLNGDEYKGERLMDKYLSGEMGRLIGMESMDLTYQKYNELIKSSFSNNKNIIIIDLSSVFCSEASCRVLDDDGYPLYFDDDHLSAHGAEWAFDEFKNREGYKSLSELLNLQ